MKPLLEPQRNELCSPVVISTGYAELEGDLHLPAGATGVVLFAHGSGSSRHSPRNHAVARVLRKAGLGTLLFDLLTQREGTEDAITGSLRFDIDLLGERLTGVTLWMQSQRALEGLKTGYFGASTGAAAALISAAELGGRVAAVVSRGGRPDLAGPALARVESPTLLIVGGNDSRVIGFNQEAFDKLRCEKDFRLVPRAGHLFEQPGALDRVAKLSADWFGRHMGAGGRL